MMAVEGRAIVAFEEQRRTMLTEQAFEVGGDLPALLLLGDQWPEAIARGLVLDEDDLPAALTVVGGVAGKSRESASITKFYMTSDI